MLLSSVERLNDFFFHSCSCLCVSLPALPRLTSPVKTVADILRGQAEVGPLRLSAEKDSADKSRRPPENDSEGEEGVSLRESWDHWDRLGSGTEPF